ncbi:MAG: GlsB/YeaQ/YmgE family stress response membrane protein [Chloroflexi bacterium]|nr:GlsB/YeaQ/YmgE family stress response membrane protein [Chloroflexota bacterium]
MRWLGNRTLRLLMPTGSRLKITAAGWLGGFLGNWLDGLFWHLGPQVAGINLVAAIIGSALFILLLGLFPFFKILAGKV